jgi:hypothetical protein
MQYPLLIPSIFTTYVIFGIKYIYTIMLSKHEFHGQLCTTTWTNRKVRTLFVLLKIYLFILII